MIVAIALTLASTVAVNWAYLREHDAAAMLPPLSAKRPLESARILVTYKRWLVGFAIEVIGFLCFVGALALAPLALVQSLAAGGIGLLAFFTARIAGVRLQRREIVGVFIAVVGLVLLGISLTGGSEEGSGGWWVAVAIWLVVSAAAAGLAVRFGGRALGQAAAYGAAAGLLFEAGDVATETVTAGGAGLVFLPAMLAAYGLGTTVLQLGFQRGGALATAGTATLFSDALPIVAGTTVYAEPFPGGSLGVVRGVAFAVLVVGAVMLSREETMMKPGCVRTAAQAAEARIAREPAAASAAAPSPAG